MDDIETISKIEEGIFYQCLMYLKLDDLPRSLKSVGLTAGEAVKAVRDQADRQRADRGESEYDEKTLNHAEKLLLLHPQWGEARIGNASWEKNETGKPLYDPDGLQACTFTNLNGDVYLSFRGTPRGSWIDNAVALIACSALSEKAFIGGKWWNNLSAVQVEAMRYAGDVLEKLKGEGHRRIHCIGHSKGGNEAQLAVAFYSDDLDDGLSFDGQGFSGELLEELEKNLGKERLEMARGKLCGVNAENDYVNVLGRPLIPSEQRTYVKGNCPPEDLLENHSISALLDDDGNLMPEVDGPGAVGRFVGRVSEELLKQAPKDREGSAMMIMGIFQAIQGRSLPVNAGEMDWVRFLSHLDDGLLNTVSLLIFTLLNTEEGEQMIAYCRENSIHESLRNKLETGINMIAYAPLSEKIKAAALIPAATLLAVVTLTAADRIITGADLLENLMDAGSSVLTDLKADGHLMKTMVAAGMNLLMNKVRNEFSNTP